MQKNILLCTNNLITAYAKNKGLVENYCILLMHLLKGTEFHFFNAYNKEDYLTDSEQSNNLYFTKSERYQLTPRTTVAELSSFIAKNKIHVIHIHQCGYDSLNLFRKAANANNCVVITTCHNKTYSLLLNYSSSYCLSKMKQVDFKSKLKLLKRLCTLNSEKEKALEKTQRMYHAIFSSSDEVVIGGEHYVSEMERILQREISNSEYQMIYNCVPYKKYFSEEFIPRVKSNEIAIVGYFDESRLNLNKIIDIWTKIQKDPKYLAWVLRIIGYGPSYESYKEKALSSQNILIENFQELDDCFYKSSIYISAANLTEIIDPFLLGAMQNALVPIVYDTSELYSEIIDHEVNGYLIPSNSSNELFQRKLCTLMDDQNLRFKLARHALAKTRKFSQQRFKDEHIKLYQ